MRPAAAKPTELETSAEQNRSVKPEPEKPERHPSSTPELAGYENEELEEEEADEADFEWETKEEDSEWDEEVTGISSYYITKKEKMSISDH